MRLLSRVSLITLTLPLLHHGALADPAHDDGGDIPDRLGVTPSLAPLSTISELSTGFTEPSSETSSPTATDTRSASGNTIITLSSPASSETSSVSVGSSLTSEGTTTTEINPTTTAASLSGATATSTTTATGASATASQGNGAAGAGRDGSKVALVVALGVGVAGWVGL